VTKEAKCLTSGTKTYTCTVCGATKVETIPSYGKHDYSVLVTVYRKADCMNTQSATYKCSRCGNPSSQRVTENDPDNHTWKKTSETAATCTEDGKIEYKCTNQRQYDDYAKCTETKTEVIPATGHTKAAGDAGTVTKPATCTEAGEVTFTCATCGESFTETIEATGEHVSDEGTVTKEATCGEDGEKTYTCTVCEQVIKTEKIAATGAHTYKNGKCTVCGSEKENQGNTAITVVETAGVGAILIAVVNFVLRFFGIFLF
jgi:hypothetical protein